MTSQPVIGIHQVTKRFGSDVVAVDNVSINIQEGEFFALLGPSGCGKTTLLRMLAGFEVPTDGKITIAGDDMTDVPPNKRPVNMVFQSYAVFPHMTVADNVSYGLKMDGVSKAGAAERVEEALSLVQLGGYGDRMPDQLSGGQRQRVALARALVKRPKVLLLDEPLSALDAKLREAMQLEMRNLQSSVGITFIMVTHDQDEALSMADRVAVMENGRVRQLAAPRELYEYPTNRFVADFIGKMNLFEGRIVKRTETALSVDIEAVGTVDLPQNGPPVGGVGIAVRPEKITLSAQKPPDDGRITLPSKVLQVAYHGNESHVFVESEKGKCLSVTVQNQSRSREPVMENGASCWVSWRPEDTLVLEE